MKKTLQVLAVLVLTCAFASLANAQATRAGASGLGSANDSSIVTIATITIDGTGTLAGILASLTSGIINMFQNSDIQGNGTNNCPGCTPSGPGQ